MREEVRNKARLGHILEAIDVLLTNKNRYSIDEVSKNPILFFGFVKHVEIIGEAVYMLTKDFKSSHNEMHVTFDTAKLGFYHRYDLFLSIKKHPASGLVTQMSQK